MNMSALPATAATAPVDPMRIWFRVMRLHHRALNAMSARLKALGLSIAQFDLLSTLTENEGMSQSELAAKLYVTKGNVSGLVDRLEQSGLVERRAIAGDRRSFALHLTAEGHRLAEAGILAQRDFVARTLGVLPASDLAEMDRVIVAWRDQVRQVADEVQG